MTTAAQPDESPRSPVAVGTRIGELEVIAVIAHATRRATWAVAARCDDGTFSTWTAGMESGDFVSKHGIKTVEEEFDSAPQFSSVASSLGPG